LNIGPCLILYTGTGSLFDYVPIIFKKLKWNFKCSIVWSQINCLAPKFMLGLTTIDD